MWICIGKKVARVGAQFARQVTNFADDLGEGIIEAKKIFINDQDNKKNVKSLKIAILGLPNVGKSTLINHLVGRPVCATSKKIHTTRYKAAAICSIDDTQLVFIDTPGLVGKGDIKRYNLEDSFKNDAENSMKEADVIGVVQDMSDLKSRDSIHTSIIDLLKLSKAETNSILILNKVDTIKKKKLLLGVVRKLTSNECWPSFSDVFMISALTGDGVDDLKNYFLDSAKNKSWDYDANTISDQSPQVIIQQLVKAKLLDDLPKELPYLITVHVDHMNYYEDDSMNIVTRVQCPTTRIARMVIGFNGQRIKEVAIKAEQELCKVFETSVRLKILIPIGKEIGKDD